VALSQLDRSHQTPDLEHYHLRVHYNMDRTTPDRFSAFALRWPHRRRRLVLYCSFLSPLYQQDHGHHPIVAFWQIISLLQTIAYSISSNNIQYSIYFNYICQLWIHLPQETCAIRIPPSILWETTGRLEGIGVPLQSSTGILASQSWD
jgi:hypothetical protein